MINYHGQPQWQYVYSILEPLCEQTIISCNAEQSHIIPELYSTLIDLPEYADAGPMTALLSAFALHPNKNFLVVACDYPLIGHSELRSFIDAASTARVAAAFFDDKENVYQPVLAWYASSAAPLLKLRYANKQFSLLRFLEDEHATKYIPRNSSVIQSIDTPEESIRLRQSLPVNAKTYAS